MSDCSAVYDRAVAYANEEKNVGKQGMICCSNESLEEVKTKVKERKCVKAW